VSGRYLEVAGHDGVVQVAHEDAVVGRLVPGVSLKRPLMTSILLSLSFRRSGAWPLSSSGSGGRT
jgi:hypothetical protein